MKTFINEPIPEGWEAFHYSDGRVDTIVNEDDGMCMLEWDGWYVVGQLDPYRTMAEACAAHKKENP